MDRKIKYITGIRLLTSMVLGFIPVTLIAQKEVIRKEVRVVKPYEPMLEKAAKINLLPVLDDTARFRPEFTYSITPHPYLASYKARPIRAARLEGESISKLYKSYLRMGVGNYLTPVGEFSINNLRSKDYNLGMYLGHISSQGKVKLENGSRVPAPYSESKAELYGQKYFRYATFESKAFYYSDMVNRYGYDPRIDTTLVTDSIRQRYFNPGAYMRFASAWPDSGHLNYDFKAQYDFFTGNEGNLQHAVRFTGSMDKPFDDKTAGLKSVIKYFQRNSGLDSASNTIVSLQPWFSQSTKEWRLKAALDATFDVRNGNTVVRLYPKISFQFNIVPEYLTAFIGMDGGLETHDLRSIAMENPYITPGLQIYNTDRKMVIYGSLFGQAGGASDYRIYGSLTLADQTPFYVNDSVNDLGNRFTVVYDDVQIVKISGEYTLRLNDKWLANARAGIYRYTMSTQEKPWNKPGFDATLRISYNMRNKILVRTDLFYVGSRYAKSLERPGEILKLPAYADINLELEYRYTKILSFFLRFNNMAGVRYQMWNQYPSQGFRFMGGFTYSL